MSVRMTPEMQRCVDMCMKCHGRCEEMISYCLGMNDMNADCMRAMMDCADMCRMTADMILRGSEMAGEMCNMCADACMRCADMARTSNDGRMRELADMCAQCADMCRSMSSQQMGMRAR